MIFRLSFMETDQFPNINQPEPSGADPAILKRGDPNPG